MFCINSAILVPFIKKCTLLIQICLSSNVKRRMKVSSYNWNQCSTDAELSIISLLANIFVKVRRKARHSKHWRLQFVLILLTGWVAINLIVNLSLYYLWNQFTLIYVIVQSDISECSHFEEHLNIVVNSLKLKLSAVKAAIFIAKFAPWQVWGLNISFST